MMRTPVGMAAVIAALGVLMVVVRVLQSCGLVGPELGRKVVHAGMGTIALSFPWVFADSRPIWALVGLSVAILLAVRWAPVLKSRFGGVLGGVDRNSWGEVFFPIGIATAFSLAQGDAASFCGAVGVLAFADTAGALVGTRWGRTRYTVAGNRKSIEGSAAVWIVSSVSVACASLALGSQSPANVLLHSLVIGLAASLLEGVASYGLDNLLLPALVVELMRHWAD